MTSRLFELHCDHSRAVLRATLRDHWPVEEVARFERAIRDALSHLNRRSGSPARYALLIDARLHGVQSRDVVERLQAVSAAIMGEVACIAVIVTSALHKRQADRINPDSLHRVFDREDNATEWIAQRRAPRRPVAAGSAMRA